MRMLAGLLCYLSAAERQISYDLREGIPANI